jgi:Arc/MetJ-type ribon-helix-helix transcriptional regulator
MTIEITKPETEALIQRHLQSGRFHDIDELLTSALSSLQEPATQPSAKARDLVELFEPVRGLFADGELDFSRTPATERPVDLS